jgi:hypothetical protein
MLQIVTGLPCKTVAGAAALLPKQVATGVLHGQMRTEPRDA